MDHVVDDLASQASEQGEEEDVSSSQVIPRTSKRHRRLPSKLRGEDTVEKGKKKSYINSKSKTTKSKENAGYESSQAQSIDNTGSSSKTNANGKRPTHSISLPLLQQNVTNVNLIH